MAKSKGYHHGQLREALLDAAMDLLTERGPEGLTLRAVARQAGVSHTAPYRHFADKEALLAATATRGFEALRSRLLAAAAVEDKARCDADVDTDVEARIVASGEAYVRFAADCPAQFELMLGPSISDPGSHPELCEASEAAFGVLVELIAEGQAKERLVEGAPTDLATFAWAAVHGLAALRASGRAPAEPELAHVVARRVLLGLKQRG